MGCPIRIFTDQRLFAPPRNFSQLITSFFVSESQGIPRTPLLTFFYLLYLQVNLYFYLLFSQYVKELRPPQPLQRRGLKEPVWIFTESNRTVCACRISFHSSILRTCLCLLFFLNLALAFLSPPLREVRWGCVENKGVEPLTLCVQGRCSSQLS